MLRLNHPLNRLVTGCASRVSPFILGLLLSFGSGMPEAGAESVTVRSVEISGNRRIDTDALKAQLSRQSGSFSDEEIGAAVKALYRTGFLSGVTASVEGGVLRFSVSEKPVIRKVFIKGNKAVEEDDLKEIFTFGSNRFLDRSKVFALIRQAISYYQAKGYYDAAFDYSVTPAPDNQVDLVLTVTEGVRYKISTITFRGLKEIEESELQEAIQTKRHKWWSSWLFSTGRLNKEMLENDRGILRQYFLDHGYIDATISEPSISPKDGEITVAFDVVEGLRYKLGALTTSGDTIPEVPSAELLKGIKSEVGGFFSASAIRDDSFVVSEKFSDRGYAFANVVPETRVSRETATVAINFAATKGKEVTVDRITIRGNDKTYDNVIRRELTIGEQELFSSAKVKRSQALLNRTGFFDEATIATEATGKDDTVNLGVNVREGSTGSFSAGAGFSSSDGVLFNSKLSENNLFGTGRSLSLNVDIGSQRDNAILTFADRRIADTFWQGSISGIRTFREYSDFDRVMSGGSVELGYPLEQVFGESFQDIDYSVEYELYNIEIKNVDEQNAADLVIASQGKSLSSAVTQKLVRNTINNPLDPKEGSRQILSIETAGLGGDENYYLAEARQQLYYPLWETEGGAYVFSWRTSLGYGDTLDDDPFPLFKRYFPGGINSVRGYKNRRLGPRDSRGNEFGGSKELINNLEFIIPLVRSAGLKGVVFYDAGQAFDDDETIDVGDLRQGWGYGLRWNSPLGPIRIEFGMPIARKDGESSMVTMFAFGAPL